MCARCDELEAENRELRRDLGYESDRRLILRLKLALNLPPQTAKLLAPLYRARAKPVTSSVLLTVMDGVSESSNPLQQIRVQMYNLRKILGPGTVLSAWGMGYRLSPAGLAKIDAALGSSPNVSVGGGTLAA